jgi:hypothetical protein
MFAQCTRGMYCKTIGDLTASVFRVKWPLAGPYHYISAVLTDFALPKAIRGKRETPVHVAFFSSSVFLLLLPRVYLPCRNNPATDILLIHLSPPLTPKSNMRSPVWCLYFCPTLHWLHESIWIFPIDLWSCTLVTSRRFCGITLRKNGWKCFRYIGSAPYVWHGATPANIISIRWLNETNPLRPL